jgi:hypothetical protein
MSPACVSIRCQFAAAAVVLVPLATVLAQPDPAWRIHDTTRPKPPIITPAPLDQPGAPPSDATVLFDGGDLSEWCGMDGNRPGWIVKDGAMECVRGSGYIRTLQNFGDCQLHIEWAAPVPPQGTSQGRGNSGVFLMGLYEVQVLDSYENKTYADGQAGALYAQYPPLVNATRPPGQWQTYDIVFARPRFDAKGNVAEPARVTVLHNGVLVQNHRPLTGPTAWMQRQSYTAHPDKLPISLQDHGNPVRFRNIWVRELSPASPPEFTFSDSLLDTYVGLYRFDETLSIEVTRKAGQLHMRLINPTREHEYPLVALSPVKFVAKSVDAGLQFQTNATGKVEAVTFTVGGDPRSGKPAR